MRATADNHTGDDMSDLLAMLRALQHQLANAMSAVCSHSAIVERQADTGRIDPRSTASLARACDQAMRVTDCVRHLLAAYDRPDDGADGRAVLEQTQDLLHALVSRPVHIEIAEDADTRWRCADGGAFVLIGQLLFSCRETVRRAGHLTLSARKHAAGEVAVELRLVDLADRPAEFAPDAALLSRLARAGGRAEFLRESDATERLRIILPAVG